MKLIVGLGNPGKKYEKTRHNMGFMAIDLFSEISQIDIDKEVFSGLLGRGKVFDEDVLLFKPTTFMNLSGTAVSQVVRYFKIPLEDIIVVFDDMALTPGNIRLRINGSSGGQKGMQNIIDQLGTKEIKRMVNITQLKDTENLMKIAKEKIWGNEQALNYTDFKTKLSGEGDWLLNPRGIRHVMEANDQ